MEWNVRDPPPHPTGRCQSYGPTRVSSYVTGHATTTHSLETNDRTVGRPVHYPNSFARSDGLERFPKRCFQLRYSCGSAYLYVCKCVYIDR
jgi:hypothetical protein